VLAEVTGQVLDQRPQRGELADARMRRIAPGLGQVLGEHVLRVLIAPARGQAGQPVLEVAGQAERLADFAGRATTTIGDHVGGHAGGVPPVAPVDVLDDRLPPLAARQVEVDVRPLAAGLGEEPLEEQLHAHGIDGGDAERVADRAVGGRAPPLDQDVVGAAVLDDVVDD